MVLSANVTRRLPRALRLPRNRVHRTAVGMLPIALLFLVPLFYVPLLALLVRSFDPEGGGDAWTSYESILSQGQFAATLKQSFEIGGIAFGIMLLIGYPLAYLICFKMKPRLHLPMLVLLIMSGSISEIVRIFAWYALLGHDGIVNRVLVDVGIADQPVDILFSRTAVIIVLTAGWLPYVVIPIYSAMRTIDREHLEAARDLYSGSFSVLKNVVLPMSAPGVLGAFIIVFVPLLSDFATPQLVGGPSSLMLGNFVSDQLLQVGNWSAAAAGATLLLLVSVVLIGIAQRVTKRYYGT